jgi:peroxiredoxin
VAAGTWLVCWLGVNIVRQLGTIVLRLEEVFRRLESIETRLDRSAPGEIPWSRRLAVGAAAPEFELPDLAGRRRSLSEFRGSRVLLIFFSPRCGYCQKMAHDLAAMPPEGADGWPVPLVVTTGDADENRRLVEEHGIRCPFLLQEAMEVTTGMYGVRGTPMGFLIDERGNFASEVATGAQAIAALAVAVKEQNNASENGAAPPPQTSGSADQGTEAMPTRGGKANKGLGHSRINRSGLAAGTPAPAFRLARLDDTGALALEDYRGRRLLIVFSDPACGPCDQLAPHLERLHRERGDLAVVMIGRRDAQLNREKVAKLGLTFPVVLQRSWEISLLYGIFATPVAYLIDEQGVIAADVATGVEPILELIASSSRPRHQARKSAHHGQEVVTHSG